MKGLRQHPVIYGPYDIRTGKQRWIFHTIPQPGEKGYETWDDPNAYKTIGGANAWGGLSLDEKRGIVFRRNWFRQL
jgi:quinoprotein glucose dehydrogenase